MKDERSDYILSGSDGRRDGGLRVLLPVPGQQGKVAVERRCAEHRRKTCEESYRKAMRQFGIYRRGRSARESKAQIQPEKRNRLYANENGQVRKADS